jgi:hypothetical protein
MEKSERPMPSEETVHTYSISPARETISPPPFSGQFLDKFPEASAARAAYLKILVGGVTTLAVVILAVFSIYWGSLWRTPHHTLPGWIVVSVQRFFPVVSNLNTPRILMAVR